MQLLSFLYPAFLTLLMLAPSSTGAAKKNPKDAILLSSVKSLTLRADKKTAHRRVPAVPQLVCNGPGCKHHKIDVMRCTNQGGDYNVEDVQWSCTASLPEEFKLGSTEVVCEGYENADDEKVLKGSCGVEYRLLLTDLGEERFGTTWWGGSKSKNSGNGKSGVEEGGMLGKALFMAVFIGVALWILYSIYQAYVTAPRQPRQPRAGGGGGGWGGGGGGGGGPWDDPPPPYSSYPGKRYSSGQEGWRPGFWSGAAGGAAAGYMAGRGQRQQTQPVQNNNGWFGGGGSGNGARPNRGSGGGSSSSGSSARYESTGFGSTSRR